MFLALEDGNWRREQEYRESDWRRWYQPDVFGCTEWQLKNSKNILVLAEGDKEKDGLISLMFLAIEEDTWRSVWVT